MDARQVMHEDKEQEERSTSFSSFKSEDSLQTPLIKEEDDDDHDNHDDHDDHDDDHDLEQKKEEISSFNSNDPVWKAEINSAVYASEVNDSTWPINFQSFYNLTSTFISTAPTIALGVTDLLDLEVIFAGVSWWGIGVAIPATLIFSICEALAHKAQSEHFDSAGDAKHSHHHNHRHPPYPSSRDRFFSSNLPKVGLTWKQNFVLAGHYLSEIISGVQPYLLPAKLVGLDKLSPLGTVGFYGAVTLFCAGGLYQDLKNDKKAFLTANERAAIMKK